MKRLPKDKQNKLVITIVGTLAVIGLIYFFLIAPMQEDNQKLAKDVKATRDNLDLIVKSIKQAAANAAEAEVVTVELAKAEEDTASGDLYAWSYDTIRRFKTGYRVDIPTIGQPAVSDNDLLPNFPYKQMRIILRGTGYYHDIGKFIANMENKFPHIRLVNLAMEPDMGPDGGPEKLSFRVDVVALVKPNA